MFTQEFLVSAQEIIKRIDAEAVDAMAKILRVVRDGGGRLFLIGSGGGAGHASHAVCDFRKICGFEAYCPSDNVSELTARINDDGWDTSLSNWLVGSKLNARDGLFVFSVGGGNAEKKISVNLVKAIDAAKSVGAKVVGVVGRDGGYTAQQADACVVVPTVVADLTTPFTESFQALVWHLLASHPLLAVNQTKWESTEQTMPTKVETKVRSVKIFADGADLNGMLEMYRNPMISGFTTNPTLMRKAGITDYKTFAQQVVRNIPDRPLSFEVFSDDFAEMELQALEIASWGANVYVKIPITNTKSESAVPLIDRLARAGVRINCTAVMTLDQVRDVLPALGKSPASYLSIFAGRVADTGKDPLPLMRTALALSKQYPTIEVLWASPRELLNIIQADEIGCHVITVTNDLLKKMNLFGKDLNEFSLDTVKMFYTDAQAAGFQLQVGKSDTVKANEARI